jgi:hypothetical protein
MNSPSLCGYKENPIETGCSLATLYNNGRTGGNGYLCFFLIVFTSAFLCAWKTCRFSGFQGRLRRDSNLAAKELSAGPLWLGSGRLSTSLRTPGMRIGLGGGARRPDYGAALCSAWG